MPKKRLLVLNYEFPPLGGGASPVSYELAKRLSETGEYDIDVVTMRYKGLPKYEEIGANLRIHRVTCLRSKKEMCYPWEQLTYLVTAYLKCRQLIKKQSFDICHTHFIIPTGILALRLKKEFDLNYVVTSHGSDVLGYNQRFKKIYPYLIKPWKSVLDNANLIISPSVFLKSKILEAYPTFDESRISIVPNGIDIDKFKPQQKKPYIFSSGRLMVNKGFQHLIEAVSNEDIGWEVHIAGDGPMRAELEEMARISKTKVVLHGWLDNRGQTYKDLLEQASIYVLASDYENASISLLEAMAAGCVVVTTNASGCAETVGEQGILVDISSPLQIFDALKVLISDKKALAIQQVYTRQKMEEKYSWDFIIAYVKRILV